MAKLSKSADLLYFFRERRHEQKQNIHRAPNPFYSLYGGVEPSNADVCFIVGGCEKPKIETRDCDKLGYKDKSCDGVKKIVYDTCVSKGEKFVKCTCNPNYYMLTASPSNATAYDIEECTKVDGKKLYRATCKKDYIYTLSTIKREDGKTNSSVCGAGKTPVADGGICTMLYGDNANKVLYKDCDCNSTYQYDKQKENGVVVEGFKYEGECKYTYGTKAGETLYTTVTCDTNNHYQSDVCKEPLVEDKAYKHSQKKDLTCRTCKCPDRYKYASDKLTGNFAVDGTKCGDLYDDYKCQNGWTKTDCTGDTKYNCETDTNKTYTDVKCYKKTPKCVYADWNTCNTDNFEKRFYHPLTGEGGDMSATCTQGNDQCWYPEFSCKYFGLKDCELGWDYPQVEVAYGDSSMGSKCCMADCTVSPINGYNTDGDCKYNLPSTQECKQVTYTNKSEVGGNTFTNLGSKSLTCFVKQCKYSTQDSCKSAYSLYFSYHPISNKKINLLKECAKDTYGCWNPVFNTCEDMGMTKREEDSSITYPEVETPVGRCMVTCKDWYKGFSNVGTYEECIQAKEVGQKCVSIGKVGTTECYYSRKPGCADFFDTGCTEKRDLAIATCEDNVDRCLMNCSGNNCCCTAENDGYCYPRSSYCEGMVGYTCDLQDVVRYYEGQKITMTCDISVDPSTKKPNIPSDVCSGKTYAQTQAYCTSNGYSTNMGHQQNCKDGLYDFCPCNQAYTKCRY